MKIEKLHITNFKGVKDFSFVPEKINVFVGPNGSGKSSSLAGIRAAITANANNPVSTGADKAVVEMTCFGGQDIVRTYGEKNSVRIGGHITTQKSITKLFEDSTGVAFDTAKLLTSSKMLSSMKAGTLSEFLLSNNLIPVEVDYDKVKSFCTLSPEAEADLSMMLPAMPEKFGMEDIEGAYKEFFAQRTAVNRELAAAQARAEFNGPIPTRKSDDLTKDMTRLSNEEMLRKAFTSQMEAYERALQKREQALKRLAELEKRASEIKVVKPDEAQAKHMYVLLDDINAGIASNEKTKATLTANAEMFRKSLATLEKPICPLSEKLICTTDKTPLKEELSEQLKVIEEEIARIETEITILAEKRDVANKKIREYNDALAAYNNAQSIFAQVKALRENLPEIPEKPKAPAIIPDLEAKMEELKNERVNAMAYEAAKKAEAEADKLKKRLTILEELIKVLDPKGSIHAKVLEAALIPLEEYCNERAKMLKMDFLIGIDASAGVRITCQPNPTAGFIDLSEVSSGEQLLATFLIMDMLNALSGFGILLMDDLDKLDESAVGALLSLVTKKEVLDSYDHIFIAAVDHEDIIKELDLHKSEIQIFRM